MKNIMTVDDSPSLRQMVCVVLRGAEYQVIEAVDGVDALSKLNGQQLHLFLGAPSAAVAVPHQQRHQAAHAYEIYDELAGLSFL